MAKRDEFDWLDDPFNDKKESQVQTGMSGGTKAAVGIGCLVAVVGIVVLLIFTAVNILDMVAGM